MKPKDGELLDDNASDKGESIIGNTIGRAMETHKKNRRDNVSDKRLFMKSFNVYRKGRAAMQMKIGTDTERPGIFIDMSDEPKGDAFNWSNKITVKLDLNDIGSIIHGIEQGEDVKLYHDPGAGTTNKGQIGKNISLAKSTKGQRFFNVSVMKDRKEIKKISIVMNDSEIACFKVLLQYSIPRLLRWE